MLSAVKTRYGTRRFTGRFKKKCACVSHDQFATGKYSLIQLKGHLSRTSVKCLIARQLLNNQNKWVCTACIQHSNDNFVLTNARRSSSLNVSSSSLNVSSSSLNVSPVNEEDIPDQAAGDQSTCTSNLCECIRRLTGDLKPLKNRWEYLDNETKESLTQLACALGDVINVAVYHDTVSVQNQYKDLSFVENTDPVKWNSSLNSMLCGFIMSTTGIHIDDGELGNSSKKKMNALTHTMEQGMYARNVHFVAPYNFLRSLVSYSFTHSKLSARLTGAWEPSGSYTTINAVLNTPSPTPQPPEHDIHVTFDNNQKVGHSSGRIRESSTVPMSICTAITFLCPRPISDLQQTELVDSEEPMSVVMVKVKQLEKEFNQIFLRYRSGFLGDMIGRVYSEQKNNSDYVDVAVAQQSLGQANNTCCKCTCVYPASKINECCPECGYDPNHHSVDYEPYHRTESRVHSEKPEIVIGDPCMVNPSSHRNVRVVLEHLKVACNIPEGRKWVIVWSDGTPYLFMCKLIESLYVCDVCGSEVDVNIQPLSDHVKVHPQSTEMVSFKRLFDYVIPRPGPGHFELNYAKMLLGFGWKPIISTIAVLLGFRSTKAQDVVRNGISHHRSRQILHCLLEALSCELLVPFVRSCTSSGRSPSVEGYFNWLETDVEDGMFMFLHQFCFTFLLAFHLYNESTRKNHYQHMMAARVALVPLLFATRHPKYQEIHARDVVNMAKQSASIQDHLQINSAFSTTGEHNRGQGADFIQEEQNKLIKSFLPPGIPSASVWQNVSRKADCLKHIKHASVESADIGDLDVFPTKKSKFDNEITMMRREIRACGMCSKPDFSKPMCSMSGEQLDPGLSQVKHTGNKNYEKYTNKVIECSSFHSVKLTPVFVTPEERQKYESIEAQTNAEICNKISQLIECLPDDNVRQYYNDVLKTIKRKKKAVLLDVFYEVSAKLDCLLADLIVDEVPISLPFTND